MATRKHEYKDGDSGEFACILADDLKPHLTKLKNCFGESFHRSKVQSMGNYLLGASLVNSILDIPTDTTSNQAEFMFDQALSESSEGGTYGKLKKLLEKLRRNDLKKIISEDMEANHKQDDDEVGEKTFADFVSSELHPEHLTELGVYLFGETKTQKEIRHTMFRPLEVDPCTAILEAWMFHKPDDKADVLMKAVGRLRVAKIKVNVAELLRSIKPSAAASDKDQTDSPPFPEVPSHEPAAVPGDNLPKLRQAFEEESRKAEEEKRRAEEEKKKAEEKERRDKEEQNKPDHDYYS